jgi:hypothetical protein
MGTMRSTSTAGVPGVWGAGERDGAWAADGWVGGQSRSNITQVVTSDCHPIHDAAMFGCSDRVAGAGCFGAALMLQPERVAECMSAIARGAPGVPVTVKCRLGVDQVGRPALPLRHSHCWR